MSGATTPTFGMLLRRYRRAAGLTQEELAGRAGLSPEGISALERGVNRAPRKDTVELLAEALALPERDRAVLENAARRRPEAQMGSADLAAGASTAARSLPVLVGRTPELALIDRLVSGGGPPALVVTGEPGVGKTRLLQEAERRAAESGWRVVAGGCQRRSGRMPYAPLLGAVQACLHSRPAVERKTDLDGCGWLVRLLPELADMLSAPAPAWQLEAEQERRLTYDAVRRYLTHVAGPAGVLLALDDLQWSDADALDLLSVLVRSTEGAEIRIVGAYSDTELRSDSPFAASLSDLARDGLVEHYTLGPLDEAAARALAESLVREDTAARQAHITVRDRLLERTGGVPFFIVSCMQALEAGALRDVPGDNVPWDAAQSIRQRVAALPQTARDVLDLAAVSGPRVPLWLLLAIGKDERERDAIADALEAACRARLLAEDGEGGYRFAHELIGDVIAAGLGAAHRASLHGRIARLLEGSGGEAPVEQLAYHYARSGDVDGAIRYLERAGDRSARMGADMAAEGSYRELVGRLDGAGRELVAAGARRKLGAALCALARYGEALEIYEEAAETYRRARAWEEEGQVTALIGQVHADRGAAQEGIARLTRLLDSLDARQLTQSTAALLYDTLAQLYHIKGDYVSQLSAAEMAAELAQSAQDAPLLAQIRMRTGNALRMLGRLGEASATMEEAIATAAAAGDQRTLAYALENVSVVYLLRGEFDRATRNVGRALALVERSGDPLALQLMVLRRGLNAFGTGDWVQARHDFERAAAIREQTGETWVSAYTALGLGQLGLAQGAGAQAVAQLEEAIRLAGTSGDLQALRWAQTALAEGELLAGKAREAYERLEPLLDRPGQQEVLVTYLMPYLAWANLELGDEARADALLAGAIARGTGENIRLALVDALRVRALLALRREQLAVAEEAAQRARALAAEMGYPHGRAKLLYTSGLVAVQGAEPERGRERFAEALGILRPLGERLYAARCERATAELSR